MKYRIMKNKVTNRYKLQKHILFFWWDVYNHTMTKETAEETIKNLIREDENTKKSNWIIE